MSPPLSIYCAGCGQKLPASDALGGPAEGAAPSSYTPRHLAEKILRDRASLEGERRNVTVLFSDAMGFTPMGEAMDEEELYQLMQGCLSCMMEAVHRYEGTVVSFTGDGAMAIFGAPIAHEDSARRALAAALEMQIALSDYASGVKQRHPSIDCKFRIGLNTGPVVVGKISDNLAMDFTAIGDTVNLAQRMESVAEPGSVYLTESTYKPVADYFECEPLGALSVKGKSAPVAAYKALRERAARSRLEVAAERGLTPFVGRKQELSVLRGYYDQATRGQGHVVFVTGEAGLGKSRLLLEFRRSLTDEPVRWLEGHCISYGKNTPYLPMADLVKRTFGVEEQDSEQRIISRMDDGAASWDAPSRETLPYLKYILNVDSGADVSAMDPRERQAGILDALRALVMEESRRRPLIVLIEDLHWADEKSVDALRALIDIVPSASVLMLITYRPGYAHSLGERTYFSRLSLSVLAAGESETIVSQVLQCDSLPAGLNDLIVAKGEGNPFYVEEVTKALVESGALKGSNGSYTLERPLADVRVPDTIQEVILSRIDRLEREARDAIQLASVIGREFTVRLLDRIADVESEMEELLSGLKTLELIYEKAYFPELSYMFKHALTHDVAYSTLLAEPRRNLHRLVGRAIEELYPDRITEHYEALAYHYYEGQDWEKALRYLEQAGDKAAAAYANQDALDYYARAIELADREGGSDVLRVGLTIAEKRGLVNFGIGDPDAAVEDFSQMRRFAEAVGDERLQGMATCWRGEMNLFGSDPERGERDLREALRMADEGHQDVRARANTWLASMLLIYGHNQEALAMLEEADAIVPELADSFTQGFWAFLRGMMYRWESHPDRALDHLQRWSTALDANLVNQVGRQWNEALAFSDKGEYSEALKRLYGALATCERTGELLMRARAENTVGWVLGEIQNHEKAIEWNKRSEGTALQINAPDPEIECNARLNLGDSLLALGRTDEAERYYRMVDDVVRNPGTTREQFAQWVYSQHFFHSYGEFWLGRGDLDKALALAEECIRLAESTNRPKNVVKGRRLHGQVFAARGRLEEAQTDMETALELAQGVGNPPQLWKTRDALGELRLLQGRDGDSREEFHAAMNVIENVAKGLDDASLRETFLSSPHVEGIRRRASSG